MHFNRARKQIHILAGLVQVDSITDGEQRAQIIPQIHDAYRKLGAALEAAEDVPVPANAVAQFDRDLALEDLDGLNGRMGGLNG
jgi:hypothetical protein